MVLDVAISFLVVFFLWVLAYSFGLKFLSFRFNLLILIVAFLTLLIYFSSQNMFSDTASGIGEKIHRLERALKVPVKG